PPEPQAVLSCLPSACRASVVTETPLTTVTALPPRPLVSRDTRATPSPAGTGARFAHAHCAMGCRQAGHMRPASVEYTSPPLEDLLFMGGDPSCLEAPPLHCVQTLPHAIQITATRSRTPPGGRRSHFHSALAAPDRRHPRHS